MFHSRDVIMAVDIGTSKVCVLIGKPDNSGSMVIVGYGEADSNKALCKGEIVDMDIALEVLSQAIDDADSTSEVSVDPSNIYMSVTGMGISSHTGVGTVLINADDRRVNADHLSEAVRHARVIPHSSDKIVIGALDSYSMIDGSQKVINPIGHTCGKLEVFVHVVCCERNRLENFETIMNDVGFESQPNALFAPIASVYGALSEDEQESGVLLLEIGAGTTEFVVVHNSGVLASGVIAVGFEHVANDLALGLDLHISICRNIISDGKYQRCREDGSHDIELPSALAGGSRKIPISSIDKIIDLRLRELFEVIKRRLDRDDLIHNLAAGVVVSGGGALFPKTLDVIKSVFELEVRVGFPKDLGNAFESLNSPRYNTVLGLLNYAYRMHQIEESEAYRGLPDRIVDSFNGVVRRLLQFIKDAKDSIKI